MSAAATTRVTGVERNRFGAFGGVFTPSILTIFGVVMFMRAGYVVGQAGILSALLILCVAEGISILTALSICAISTNTAVSGGGSYFLISRVLGPEFGGAVGLSMFFTQALAVPFYILGFVEALTQVFPTLQPYFLQLTLAAMFVLFVITFVGASWAIRVQYVILAALLLAIAAFLSGAAMRFDPHLVAANWKPAYTSGMDFWKVFAIYFPAVTGMDAGLNMSGDLENPSRAIPRGILAAVFTGFIVYGVQLFLCGAAIPREQLLDMTRGLGNLMEIAVFRAGFLVVVGVLLASVSSALGSMMGSPRILQALARDNIFPVFRPFAVGAKKGDEPRRALILSSIIGVAVLLYAGNGGGGAALNFVASLITMFFLTVYGIINLAAFVESFGLNPSFRPRFRFFHWSTAVLGAAGCVWAMVLIDVKAAAVATVGMALVVAYTRKRQLKATFGDARRGFFYSRVRSNLLKLRNMPQHPKNWRPTIMVLSGLPSARPVLIRYAEWLSCRMGIVSLVQVVRSTQEEGIAALRNRALANAMAFVEENSLEAFPEAVVTSDFDEALPVLLQSHSIGPIKPNLLLMGWPQEPGRIVRAISHARTAYEVGMSVVLLSSGASDGKRGRNRIDIWWLGQENGSLMLILAHLLRQNWAWRHARLRVLRKVSDEAAREPASAALRALVEGGRVEAEVSVVVSKDPFEEVLHRESADASLVFLGFKVPERGSEEEFFRRMGAMVRDLPTTLLVCSSGDADLLA